MDSSQINKTLKEENYFWFDCECNSVHHAIRAVVWTDEDFNEFTFEMRVNNYKSFWRRLWAGVKYIFNFGNKDCSYDSFCLKMDDVDKLTQLLVEYKQTQERVKEKYEQRRKEKTDN